MNFIGDFPHAWETGIGEIDDGHKHLFNMLQNYLKNDENPLISPDEFLDQFSDELKRFFEKEETLMVQLGLSDLEKIKAKHGRVFERLDALKRRKLDQHDIGHECQKAFIRDLVVQDLTFKKIMNEKRAAE